MRRRRGRGHRVTVPRTTRSRSTALINGKCIVTGSRLIPIRGAARTFGASSGNKDVRFCPNPNCFDLKVTSRTIPRGNARNVNVPVGPNTNAFDYNTIRARPIVRCLNACLCRYFLNRSFHWRQQVLHRFNKLCEVMSRQLAKRLGSYSEAITQLDKTLQY